MAMARKPKPVYAWAWMLHDYLCYAEPMRRTKKLLLETRRENLRHCHPVRVKIEVLDET